MLRFRNQTLEDLCLQCWDYNVQKDKTNIWSLFLPLCQISYKYSAHLLTPDWPCLSWSYTGSMEDSVHRRTNPFMWKQSNKQDSPTNGCVPFLIWAACSSTSVIFHVWGLNDGLLGMCVYVCVCMRLCYELVPVWGLCKTQVLNSLFFDADTRLWGRS